MGLKSNWKPYIFGSGNRVRISLASLKPSCDQGEDMLWVWAQSNRYSHCLVFKPHTYITIDGWGCAPLNYPSTLYSFNTYTYIHTGRSRIMWRLVFKKLVGWYVEFFDFEGCRAKKGFSVRFCRKNCPIFTFDMSLERYWTVDFRILENLENWAF